LLASDLAQPNGLCFNLEESALFVADAGNRHVRKIELRNRHRGGLAKGDVFCESPAPDVLKIDSCGYLSTGGVHVYHYDGGAHLGVVQTPEFYANYTWGDDDYQTMCITASTALFRIHVNIPGSPPF